MLPSYPADHATWPRSDHLPRLVDLEQLLPILRRQWKLMLLLMAAALLLGLAYLAVTPPVYTASTSLLIDRGNTIARQFSDAAPATIQSDDAVVASEIEIVESRALALLVVDKLNLALPASERAGDGVLASLRAFLPTFLGHSSGDGDRPDARESAARRLSRNLLVERAGRSYVISVSYRDPSAEEAANVVNTVADAYLHEKLIARLAQVKGARAWLQRRVEELREKVVQSEKATQTYRVAHDLLSTNGELITDREASSLNASLIEAKAAVASAQARYARIQTIVDSSNMDALVSDALGSSIVTDLRRKYLEAARAESDISARLGATHEQAMRLRSQMAEYRRLMFGELARIGESYKSDLDVALAKERSLSLNLATAMNVLKTSGQTQIELRELERASNTFRDMYEAVLKRLQEAEQQESFPLNDARIITAAAAPDQPSGPRKPLIVSIAALFGLCFAAAGAAAREFSDHSLRGQAESRQELGLDLLGIMPLLALPQSGDGPAPASRRALSAAVNDFRASLADAAGGPLSVILRKARAAAASQNGDGSGSVFGIISVEAGNGKTTFSALAALMLAEQGYRTLLIDGDGESNHLTTLLGPHAAAGLADILTKRKAVKDVFLLEQATDLVFLPNLCEANREQTDTGAMLTALIAGARASFDYVILDLPAGLTVSDAPDLQKSVDGFILLAEWGRTSRKTAKQLLDNDPDIRQKCLGLVLNKADGKRLPLYSA